MEIFASSWIATAAHVGGLLSGLIMVPYMFFLVDFFWVETWMRF